MHSTNLDLTLIFFGVLSLSADRLSMRRRRMCYGGTSPSHSPKPSISISLRSGILRYFVPVSSMTSRRDMLCDQYCVGSVVPFRRQTSQLFNILSKDLNPPEHQSQAWLPVAAWASPTATANATHWLTAWKSAVACSKEDIFFLNFPVISKSETTIVHVCVCMCVCVCGLAATR